MAAGDERRGIKWPVGVAGGAMVGLSAWVNATDGSTPYALVALILGVLLVVLSVAPSIKSLGVKAPGAHVLAEFQQRELERDAAARAADAEVPPEEVAEGLTSTDQGLPTPSAQDAEVIGTLNYVAGNIALEGIFDWIRRDGPLAGCELRLYLYDADLDRLAPVLEPRGSDEQPATLWEIGKGATGAAYEAKTYVLATGKAVSDETYKLTVDQQQRFRRLAAVAAAPVFNASGEVLGVLTASTSDLGHQLATPDARREHTLGALLVSRVLVELLQWFDDDGGQGAVTPSS